MAVMAFTAPAFSIVQLGVQGNYASDTWSNGSKYSGAGFGGFARFTAGIPMLVTLGFGPYVDYASLSGGPSASPNATQVRVGGELAVYLDVVGHAIGFTPYVRFGYGYAGNTANTTYTVTGTTTATANAFYYGTSGHTLFGLSYKVLPLIHLFAEGGIQWSSLTASIPQVLSNAGVSTSDITTSGWRASIGAMVWL